MAVQRVYLGWRDRDGCKVWRIVEGRATKLPPCNQLRNHSPDGFNWGYMGSGPAQLALALCVDVLFDKEHALDVYQAAKGQLVGRLEHDAWVLTELSIRDILTPFLKGKVHAFPLGVWARKAERLDTANSLVVDDDGIPS